MVKITRLGLPDRFKMYCKRCGQNFYCNLQCLQNLKERGYDSTIRTRGTDHICLCWMCDESQEEWKAQCQKGSGIDFNKMG